MTNEEIARRIIEKIAYITLATCSKDGQPWNSPVYAFHDENYNFYWASWTENQHSKNIRKNPNVFIVIYDSTAPEGAGEGIYIKARVYEINDEKEVESILKTHYGKTDQHYTKMEEFLGSYPRRFYKAVPEKVWINGDGEVDGNYVDIRIEVDLLK